jgi:hypothetical protein
MIAPSRKPRFRIFAAVAIVASVLACSVLPSAPAQARVFIGFSVGFPGYWGYYGPGPYYAGYYYTPSYYWYRPWYRAAAYPAGRWHRWYRRHPYRHYWR